MIKATGTRKRTCKHCQAKKQASEGFIVGVNWVCSQECGYNLSITALNTTRKRASQKAKQSQENKEKAARAKHRERKKEVKPISWWKETYQKLVNQYVTHVRDKDEPCCTCGTTNPNIKYDAGHFIAVGMGGADPRRYELTNIHKQCSVKCNQHGSGMRAEYREFITARYGREHLEWLECESNFEGLKTRFPHWSDYENEIKQYRKLLRDNGITPCR